MKRGLAVFVLFGSLFLGSQLATSVGADGPQINLADRTLPPIAQRFTVPAEFRVELAVRPPDEDKTFSLVNCCFDDKGQLLVSKENGPILLCSAKDKDGVLQHVKTYCDKVHHCQGMTWIKDSLWLVGEGPQGTGLYRCRDTKNTDQIDEVTLVHAFKGSMGETGPHGIAQGPDGMIYCVLGNGSWAQIGNEVAANGANPEKLAANSPLTRWPSGGAPPEPGGRNRRTPVAAGPAVGGAIWRLDPAGKKLGLVACGFRNACSAAFTPNGALLTADSGLESEEGLPSFRPVRVYHCPPGADFVWRTGEANALDYYLDTLPPLAETGKGAPGGLAIYDHVAFPKEYRDACFLADGSAGTINAIHLKRDGAGYKSTVESFCKGISSHFTDLCIGPDGAVYFVLRGRQGPGGVYRIVYKGEDGKGAPAAAATLAEWPQPLAAWSQKALLAAPLPAGATSAPQYIWEQFLNDSNISTANRIRISTAFQQLGHRPGLVQIAPLLADKDAELRAHAVWLIGVNGFENAAPLLIKALGDLDPLVRRRSCEALVCIGAEPPIENLWPLLGEKDRLVRYAARLLLERIDPKKWVNKVWTEPKSYREINETATWNGVIAVCHMGKANLYVEEIFGRLHGNQTNPSQGAIGYPLNLLEWLRAIQVALASTERRPIWTGYIVRQCEEMFPHQDMRVNRELASLLSEFQREGRTSKPIQGRLLQAMAKSKDDHVQQIHYANCVKSLRTGWTPESVKAMTLWYDGTSSWAGGSHFTAALENIYKECAAGFAVADKQAILDQAEQAPLAATALARQLRTTPQPELIPALRNLSTRLRTATDVAGKAELYAAVNDAIAAPPAK